MPEAYSGTDRVVVAAERLEHLLCVVAIVWLAKDRVLKTGNRITAKDYAGRMLQGHIFRFLNRLPLHEIRRRFMPSVLIFS